MMVSLIGVLYGDCTILILLGLINQNQQLEFFPFSNVLSDFKLVTGRVIFMFSYIVSSSLFWVHGSGTKRVGILFVLLGCWIDWGFETVNFCSPFSDK